MRQAASVAATLLLTAACAAPTVKLTVEHRRAMIDSVQTALDSWRADVNGKRFGQAATFYSNDADFRWYEDGQLKYRSGREVGDSMRAMTGVLQTMSFTLIEPDITPLAPGVAAISTAFVQKLTDTAGQTMGYAGAITATMIDSDSGWKFLVGHTSAIPPPDSIAARKPGRGGRAPG
jgi:ketosteroid isomerase-like protein